VTDVAAVALSFVIGYLVRNWLFAGVRPELMPFETVSDKLYVLAVYPFVFAYEGLYTRRLTGWEETRRYVRGVLVATAVVVILLFIWRYWIVSRFAVVLAAAFALLVAPVMRAAARRLLVRLGLGLKPLVILGGGGAAELFGKELSRHRALGYTVAGRVERNPEESVIELCGRLPGRDGALVVVSDSFTPEELRAIFRQAEQLFAEVMVVPNEALLETSAADLEQVGNVLVMKYRYNLLKPVNRAVKRVLELSLTVLLLVVLAPCLAVMALLVRLSSPGPVFFRQPRIGRFGRRFRCLKFRTMYTDAEQRLEGILAGDERVRAEYEKYARISRDPRVTPAGRFLRRFSLDELPQLWNALRGEMALVGPRPYLPSEAARVGDALETITRVRPGLTGLWQVSGRADLPFRERNVLDEYYIRNWSLWLDFSILLRTFRAVFSAEGAY
jgi:undecaprenyl-phosphate galactose phosphotransferase